ncbi:uncharacterized protein LOC130716176 [Lotus japonicus]|uniref:uncharacterized protein LOC130716176 n=1 Tax=Lotus japonicus TaxID=34305 RepID=UPI002582D304|nr:uncharacterized protein LOC130716176 [Lotus japonicus]
MESPPYDTGLPVASTAIVMVTPPDTQDDTQDGAQDVFHTPREDSSLTSSDNQQPTVTVDFGVVHCSVSKVFDSGTQGFVDLGGFPDESEFMDLGKDSGLGFPEAADEISPGSGGDGMGEIPGIQADQFGVSDADAENQVSDDADAKNQVSGDADAENPSNLDGEQMPEDEICIEVSYDEDLGSGKKSETLAAADLGTKACDDIDRDGYLTESETLIYEVTEDSGKRGGSDKATEDSGERGGSDKELVQKRAAEDELKSGPEKRKFSGYDVLKVMAENNAHRSKDEPTLSLLETARLIGITFPRPRWWPKNDDRFASGLFLFEETS